MINNFGIGFGILGALFNAGFNAVVRSTKNKVDALSFGLYSAVFSFLLLLPIVIITGFKIQGIAYYFALFAVTILDGTATLIYIKSIQESGLSRTVPLLSLTPIFLLIISYFSLGEIPTYYGITGVVFIVIGAYVLNINKKKYGLFEPFIFLFKENGTRMMLLVSLMYAFGANFYKIGFQNSSEIIFFASASATIALFYIAIALFTRKTGKLIDAKKHIKLFIGSSVLNTIGNILIAYSMTILFVSYAISLKRLSILFSVLFGYFIFKEKDFKEKIIGSLIMITGVIIISLYG